MGRAGAWGQQTGVLLQQGIWPKKYPQSGPQPGGNPCTAGLIVFQDFPFPDRLTYLWATMDASPGRPLLYSGPFSGGLWTQPHLIGPAWAWPRAGTVNGCHLVIIPSVDRTCQGATLRILRLCLGSTRKSVTVHQPRLCVCKTEGWWVV